MAIPTPPTYTPKVVEVGSAVNEDISTGWGNSPTFFDINTLPPGFTFDNVVTMGGTVDVQMVYYIAIRAGNADGVSDWAEFKWTSPNIVAATSSRTLLGLSQLWTVAAQFPISVSPGVLFIKRGTLSGAQSPWNAGVMLLNDIADGDGASADYNTSFLKTQIILDGITPTFLRATEPGWEIILDIGANFVP